MPSKQTSQQAELQHSELRVDGFNLSAFNTLRPFSSFLPGIAGEFGKPFWVFYTNRGQCISSFGVRDRNGAMLEFQPADKAYALTAMLGFRTFFKLYNGEVPALYEPFKIAAAEGITQRLTIRPEEIEIEEIHSALGLRICIQYFTLANESLPVLVRRVTLENIGANVLHGDVLDGLPQIVPYGLNEQQLKQMSRTMQAFAEITHVADKLPFYKLKVMPSDKPEMEQIDAGFFAFTLQDGKPIPVLADPELVFGSDTSLQTPLAFMRDSAIDQNAGRSDTLTGCAFAKLNLALVAGAKTGWESYFGQAPDWDTVQVFRNRLLNELQYAERKRAENNTLISSLSAQFDLIAEPKQLGAYTRQAFLDNTMRGGQPVVIQVAIPPASKGQQGSRVFHIFTRKHGDMERDYNLFDVAPNYLSQGNGNFRDVNQNRRSENYTFFGIDAANIETFFNLIQIDGNNPLVVQPEKFQIAAQNMGLLQNICPAAKQAHWQTFLASPFSPGQLMQQLLEVYTVELAKPIFSQILGMADLIRDATHGEGYWVDHWIYNLDLIDSYASLYPDKMRALLIERSDFMYFDNNHIVQPRAKKYLLRQDGKVRQFQAVIIDANKTRLIADRTDSKNWMRTAHGLGSIYRSTLLAKLIHLLAIKTSLLDPFGVGLEMETDKPGWCDALNGLPGLFGSSTHEAFVLRRGIAFADKAVKQYLTSDVPLLVPIEVATFVRALTRILGHAETNNFFATWQQLASLREEFRAQVRMGIAGEESSLSRDELLNYFSVTDKILQQGLAKAVDENGLPISYFIHEVESYDILAATAPTNPIDNSPKLKPDLTYVQAKRFIQKPVSNFLEGAVHALRATDNPASALALYQAVRQSSLFDQKLGMYRVNCPLDGESFEIGRSRIFSPGWLENESIFLHMHYKYLLETLRSGLAAEFFEDLKRGLVAFQSAEVYGRSPLENSSFIASSRFPDANAHGVGFVARLSGATAEWISMVLHMGLGAQPFKLVDGLLRFEPMPTLAAWLFTTTASAEVSAHCFGFKLFGKTWVVYENPTHADTFGPDAVVPVGFDLHFADGVRQSHSGSWLPADMALSLRDCQLSRLVIHLG